MIESITSTINGNPISELPNYVSYSLTYSDGVEIRNNDLLSAGNTESYKVKLLYRQDIDPGDLPGSNNTINIEIGTDYSQRNSSAVPVNHPIPAGTLLRTNPDGTTPAEKSPYVEYNNETYRVLYDLDSTYGWIEIVSNNPVKSVTSI